MGHNKVVSRPVIPPDTGASMNTAPIFSAATAISLDTAGSMVLESIRSVPFFTFLKEECKIKQKHFKYHHNKKPRDISMSLTCCELQIRESEITFLKEATYDQVCIYLLKKVKTAIL